LWLGLRCLPDALGIGQAKEGGDRTAGKARPEASKKNGGLTCFSTLAVLLASAPTRGPSAPGLWRGTQNGSRGPAKTERPSGSRVHPKGRPRKRRFWEVRHHWKSLVQVRGGTTLLELTQRQCRKVSYVRSALSRYGCMGHEPWAVSLSSISGSGLGSVLI